jgi:hypothetical protein
MNVFIASEDIYPELREKILLAGGKFVPLGANPFLPVYESKHADMQVFDLGGRLAVRRGIDKAADARLRELGFELVYEGPESPVKYPECVSLNALLCGNYLIHKTSVTAEAINEFAAESHLVKVDVRQGYTRCSACYIPLLDLIVTGDEGISKAAGNHSFNIFFVEKEASEKIVLEGYGSGFVGGTMGWCAALNTLFVNGSLSSRIPELCELLRQSGISIVEAEGPLKDIGGIVSVTA